MFKAIMQKLRWFYNIADDARYEQYLRRQGVRIGQHFMVWSKTRFSIDLSRPWLIEIGDNVEIAEGVTILTHGYEWCVVHHKTGEILGSAGKVSIGSNVFIGMHATILAGTTIGDNVIIGADSVVKGVLEPDSVYAGNPARKIMSLEDYANKRSGRQLQEAVTLVLEYKKVYGTYPEPEVLHEFFWLFEDSLEGLRPCFRDKLALRGNWEHSSRAFAAHSRRFDGYEDFLNYCKRQEQSC